MWQERPKKRNVGKDAAAVQARWRVVDEPERSPM
jgi:hypothetical protein